MSDLISRETMKDAIDSTTWYHQNRNKDMVGGAHGVEDAWFKAEDVFKAIENVPTAQPNTPTDTPTNTPTDCISRQAAIDALEEPPKVPDTWSDESAIGEREQWEKDVKALNSLPSAQPERCEDCRNFNKARLLIPQPERKMGKWTINDCHAAVYKYHCSECGANHRARYDYCPSCGADMRGEQDG